MNYTGPKVRLSRRLGVPLTPKASKYLDRRPNPPGQHGPNMRRKKVSDYGRQLLEKQRLRFQYNVSERQLHNLYYRTKRKVGDTGELMVQQLETRLDAFVLRAGFARSIYAARQFVRHGHFNVNGKRVDLPGIHLQPGDTIAVRPRSRKLEIFRQSLGQVVAPSYIEVIKPELNARLLRMPQRDEIPVICNVTLVIEYYSR